MCADFQVNITPDQQLQLQKRLTGITSRVEREKIFSTFMKEIGAVDRSAATENIEEPNPIKGASVEKSAANVDDKNVVSKTQTQTTSFANLTDALKKAGFELDDKAVEELKTQLTSAGIAINEAGNIDTTNQETINKLNTTLANFAKSKQETQLKFDENTDQEFIDKMVSDGSIAKNEDGTYKVLDKAKAEKVLNHVDQEPTVEPEQPVELSIDSEKTTETTRREHSVQVEDDLSHNRAGRKKAEKDFKAELEEWVKDPENQATMNYSIAQNKYAKKISKQADKIKKETNDSSAEILLKYYNGKSSSGKVYATDAEKAVLKQLAENALKGDEKELLNVYRRVTGDKKATFDGDTGKIKKMNAALMKIAEEDPNFDSSVLLERMAVIDVMGARSPKQVAKDKKDFIADEAKRQTKAVATTQNIANTEVHFSKEQRKNAKGNGKNNTDIGKIGRRLVMECPDEFCIKGSESDYDFIGDNGQHYKFSQEKWKNFAAKICDSRSLDDKIQENFDEDGNLTLKEGRNAWLQTTLVTKDNKTLTLEQILGGKRSQGRVSNKELNQLRHMIESAGNSVDRNGTAAKRFGRVMAYMGLGGLSAGAAAVGGSLLAGAINVAGNVAYSGVTDSRIIQDKTTFKYTNNGETFTQKVTKNIKVDGQEYSGQTPYKDKGQNHLKTASNASILGALGGAITGLATMHKVHAKGKNFDGIVRLTKDKTEEKTEDSKIKLTIPKSKTVTVRSGQIEEKSDVPTRKAVRYRGPEAYTVLYQIDGAEIPAKYRRAVYQKLDQMWREGTNGKKGDVPRNIPVYGSFTINIDGQEITVTRKDNWDKVHIQEGRPGGRGGVYNSGASEVRTYRGRGKFIN